MECIAAFILAGLLFATGAGIGFSGVEKSYTGAICRRPACFP